MFALSTLLFTLFSCSGEEKEFINPYAGTEESNEFAYNPRVHRLTHTQWASSVEALTGLDVSEMATDFQSTTLSNGFSNNGEILSVDTVLFQDYQRAAEIIATQVVSNVDTYATVVPEDPREGGYAIAYELLVEAESSAAVGSSGTASGERYNLFANGTLSIEVDLPSGGLYTIGTLVSGTICTDGLGAGVEIRVDGQPLTEAYVTEPEEVSVEADIDAGAHIISIAFTNDCQDLNNGYDRNLFIDWIEVVGGIDLGTTTQTVASMESWVDRVVMTAFRRPLSEEELEQWTTIFAQGGSVMQTGDDIADGVQMVLTALLQSPKFLYRLERTKPQNRLGPYELASKLSFQLCDAPPDQPMWEDLERGRFFQNYREHAERLLYSECGQQTMLKFHQELLHWNGYANIDQPDADWDASLNDLFIEEIRRFVSWHLFTENGSLREMLTANYTIANQRLASLYGVEGASEEFERIELDPSERSGILTLLGPLAAKSDLGQSSPIHRGLFINDTLLCQTLPHPPDVIPNLPEQDGTLTNRERVEAHTGEGTCGEGCHSSIINPPGFAMENYDELGRFRTEDNGKPVDASDSYYFMLDGLQSWQTGIEFTEIVAESQEAHSCYAQHLMGYFLGRPVSEAKSDEKILTYMTQSSMDNTPILELVLQIVQSEAFQWRGDE